MNKCIVCGQETKNKKYCSNECKYKNMSHEKKSCLNCGKKVSRCEVLYCSKKCYHEHKRKEFEKTIKYNKCIICGKLTVNEKYCSMKYLGKDTSRIATSMNNLPNDTYWTDEEILFLKENYGVMPIADLCNYLHRNQGTIIQYAQKHNISSKRMWTNDDIEFLLDNVGDIDLLVDKLGKSKSAIVNKLASLNGFRDELGCSLISPQSYIEDYIANELHYPYVTELRVDKYTLDIVLLNIDIEIHGSYWHCDERIFSGNKTETQKKAIEKDKVRKAYLESLGYKVIYIWEYDIVSNPQKVKETIGRKIKEHLNSMETSQREQLETKFIEQIKRAIKKEQLKTNKSNERLSHLNYNLQKLNKRDWPN